MPQILTISGWTRHFESLAPFAPHTAEHFDYSAYLPGDAAFNALSRHREKEHIIAWSQGAQLALRAMAKGVLAPKKVTLLAPPMFFVKRQSDDPAMDDFTYQTFCENYKSNAARTKARFNGLVAMGDAQQKQVMEGLIHHPQVEDVARWLPWLLDLKTQDLRDENFSTITADVQIIHGENDGVIRAEQSKILAARLPNARLHLWENCAHAPHLHHAQALLDCLAAHHQF